jgi:Zn-dependent protease with chaperone function
MFALRCVGVSLAFFLAQYCLFSALIVRTWKWLARPALEWRPRYLANYLLGLRLLPLVAAFGSTAVFVLPSFLLLEPRATNEAVGEAPTVLSICCLLLVTLGLWKALRAQARSARAVSEWLREATPVSAQEGFPHQPFPLYRIRPAVPALTVAGVCAPRVLVSNAAANLLDSQEMRTALQHEVAHIRHRDNLKKLFFNFTAFPGMAGLEAKWSDACEMAADDAAVASAGDALDLASALIKLSRLGPVPAVAALTTSLVQGSNASLNSRVERLLAWQQLPATGSSPRLPRFAIPAGLAMGFVFLTSYSAVLTRMHEVTEWLVR